MHLPHHESPPLQPESFHETQAPAALGRMTAARRAALEALEDEFHELLVRSILKSAGR